jgi:PAS domain S-box-containing protein
LEREFELSRKDGKRIKIDISAFALRRENGEPLCFVGTLRDVTEASKAREALRESEERFRRFADNVDDVFWISDPDKKRMLYVNAAFERVFRLKPEEIYAESRAFLRNCHPEDRPRVEEMVARQKFGPAEVEYRIVRPDRSLQWIQSRTFPVRNESGSVYCIVGISRDITFQKQAADDLKESEVRFRQFAENIQEVFWMSDPAKNRMIYVSPAYEKIWGKSRESLYSHPMSFLDGIHPEDRARVERALEKQVRGEYDEEYRITQPDGTLRWIRDRAFPIRDEGGTVYRVAGIAEDITEAKLSEGDLLLLANITAMSVDAISTVDMDGTVTSWNRAGEDIFGFKGEEIIGKNVRDTIIPPDLKTEAFRVFDREPFAVIRQRTERLHKSGRRFPVLLTGFPLVDERGNIYGRAAIHQDITHIVDMERKLLEQSRMAAIGSMAAGIAHEIRNPLFGISSVAQILSREFAEKPPLDELANSMLEEIERLNKLLKNLLMYARPRRLECSRVRPKELFDEFMSLNQHLIRAQGVRIVARFEPENGEITADDAQIRQVILNLCLNAVQASPLNSVIEIRSQVTPERGWAFEIRNDGDSIEPANLPQIFEPFFSTKSEGSGLGLSVCKKVVEDHGGTIGCVSNKESGTSFSFSIPPAPLDAPAQSCQKEATP